MPIFMVTFERSTDLTVEATSIEEARSACKKALHESWLLECSEWEASVTPVDPRFVKLVKKAEMGVFDGDLMEIDDYLRMINKA